jgi:hypothetical protein
VGLAPKRQGLEAMSVLMGESTLIMRLNHYIVMIYIIDYWLIVHRMSIKYFEFFRQKGTVTTLLGFHYEQDTG